jgi:hypothetical protein
MSIEIPPVGGNEASRLLSDGRVIHFETLIMGGGRIKVNLGPKCRSCTRRRHEHPDSSPPFGPCDKFVGPLAPWTVDPTGSDEVYDYDDFTTAFLAFERWDNAPEPEQWYRHKPSNRRRKYNDDGTYTEEVRE